MTRLTILLLTTLFLVLGQQSRGQTQLLKNYDFNVGGYYILGVFSESDRNGLQDTLGEFYTDSIPILNEFKKAWAFKKPSPKYACGYHYTVFVCRNGIAFEHFNINLNCNEITSDKGYFYFDTQKLRMFKGKLKKPYRKSTNFSSLTEAREYIKNVRTDSSLIMTPFPEWTKFEGEFDFTYKCPEGKKICFEKEDSLKKAIKKEIMKIYPLEIWEISDRGGSWTTIDLILSCNKSLSDKFNLYYRDTTNYFGKWRPYKLDLTTYWTKKQKAKQESINENFLDTFLLSLNNELAYLSNSKNKISSITSKFKAVNAYLTSLLPKLTTTNDTAYLAKKKSELKWIAENKNNSDTLSQRERLLAEICLLDIENSSPYYNELLRSHQSIDDTKLLYSDSFCFFKAWLNQLCTKRFPDNKTFRYNTGVTFYNHGVYLNTLTIKETTDEIKRRQERASYFLNKSKAYFKP